MRKGSGIAALIVGLALLLAETPAQALITALTPLQNVLRQSTFIVSATVESVDADKPALVLVVEEDLKGKSPLRKLPVLLKGDAEARKKNHVPLILKRVAPRLPLLLFILQQDKKYTAFAYSNGTWFQIAGVESDGAVRWSFTHGEPYLRKTFKGSTAELKQVVVDGLAGKKEPPKPDTKEKPGFGPEVEAKKESRIEDREWRMEDGTSVAKSTPSSILYPPSSILHPLSSILYPPSSASSGGTLFAVIPTVLVGGPLAILAMLFPAVFGGLMLVLRRWLAALSVLSLNSTLYVLQDVCRRWLAGSWWGTPLALWLTMTVVTLLGILWAWRRHLAVIADDKTEPRPLGSGAEPRPSGSGADNRSLTVAARPPHPVAFKPGRVELMTLTLLSGVCLILAIVWLPRSVAQLDLWGKTLLMFSAGLWTATLHAFYLRWVGGRGGAMRPSLPSEGILLWTMLLAGAAFGATLGGESSGPGVSADDNSPYRVAWRFRPGENCWMASSPVLDDDRIFVGIVVSSAFGNSGAVCCVDRRSGQELWRFNDGGGMKSVFSSPCLADGRLYIGEGFHQDADCKLYCLDAATGQKRWEFATTSHTESSPCAAAGKVYFGAGDDGLYCLDAATGEEQWHFQGLHIDANPLVAGNRLYGGSGVGDTYKDTVLFCLDAATGKEQWRMPADLPMWGKPALFGDYLYAALGNGDFVNAADKPAGAVLCLEAATGKRHWRYDVPDGVYVRVSVDAKNVWFAARDRHGYCLDRRDGTLRWKTDLGAAVVASPFLVEGGSGSSLYAANSDGLVSRLDADTGAVSWTFDVSKDAKQSATIYSSPAVMVRPGHKGESRLIYFGCRLNEPTRGILYCLEERTVEKAE